MRICLTHYAFYPTTGGVESHLLDLGTELVNQGHEVFALVGSLDNSPPFEDVQGIKIHRRMLLNPFYIRERKAQLGAKSEDVLPTILNEIRAMYESFIQEHKIDVMHAHNFHHFLPGHALMLTELRTKGLPTVLTIHEVWSEFICEDLLERSKWDTIVTVSKHVAEGIRAQAPHLTNVQLVYHGIDTALFSPDNKISPWVEKLGIQNRPVIIHPARMLPWKGVLDSVRAMDSVRKEFPDAVLIITDTDEIIDWIGELKGYREEVLETIRNLGLEQNVITQPFPYLELPGVYNHCDIVVYPTIGEEPFGLVPVEAMACEKPVIVTKSGGLVESVIDGETGYIINKGDVEALADRIRYLLRNKSKAERLGRAGRARALNHFSRGRMARQMIDIYGKAIGQKVKAKLKTSVNPATHLHPDQILGTHTDTVPSGTAPSK